MRSGTSQQMLQVGLINQPDFGLDSKGYNFSFSLNQMASISDMNAKLKSLQTQFTEQTTVLQTEVSKHEGRLTPEDYDEFAVLVRSIKNDMMTRISQFFTTKIQLRSKSYEVHIDSFTQDSSEVDSQLHEFRKNLESSTIAMKEEQHRKEKLMEHFSKKYRENTILKKSLRAIKNYQMERQQAHIRDRKMDGLYAKNLMKKAFFPWRTLTYKDGYANSVRRETEKDIMNVHEQYQQMINILKTKTAEADEIIKVKKAAKGEFTYALSKNLLKTISNLSMDVMSLNQMSLRDGQWNEEETHKFMAQVDHTIKSKLSKIRDYRRNLLVETEQGDLEQENLEKKKKKITFV